MPDDEGARTRSRWLLVALAGLLVLPLFVALIGFREPTWTPVLDLAQTELRVRDVGTTHTPLIGLPGRISYDGHQGSHPGPLSFYALAPVYRLLGASAFSLQAATVAVHGAAIVVALLLARRRGGTVLMVGTAAVIAVLVNGFGVATLSEPWNPYLPLLWWIVVLLGVWSVLAGDVVLLPVVVVAASFCAQTHVPYLAPCLALGALAAAATLTARRYRVVAIAAATGVVLWLPPVVDQLRNHPGNLGIIVRYFTNPANGNVATEPTPGLREAARLVVQHLDVFHLTIDQLAHPGLLVTNDAHRHATTWHGVVVVVLWLAAVAIAAQLRHRVLMRLHLVTGVAFVIAVLATSRIYGEVWYYLLLSIWGIAALMAITIVWTAAVALTHWRNAADDHGLERVGVVALLAIALVFSIRSTWVAPSASHSDATVVRELQGVLPGTLAAVDHHERYLLAADDAAFFLSPMYGMLNELDRRGFDVGVIEGLGVVATKHRVMHEDDATAKIQIATGIWVDAWRSIPGAREVAFFEPRSDQQRARFDALRTEVMQLLRDAGRSDLVPLVDRNLFAASIAPGLDRSIRTRVEEMLTLGVPIGVFIAPPGAHLPP